MRSDVGPSTPLILQKGNGFWLAVTVVVCLVAGGCSFFKKTQSSNLGTNVSIKDLTADDVLSRLRTDSWLFKRVMLQDTLSESTVNEAWKVYQAAQDTPDKELKSSSYQRKTLSQVLAPDRSNIINKLENDDSHKNAFFTVGKLVLQHAAESCDGRRPRIHAIQVRNVLHYQDQGSTNQDQIIQIPIEGKDLHPDCVDLQVVVIGKTFQWATSATKKYLDIIKPTSENPDVAFIVLTNEYLKTLTSGDQLEIHVMISQHDFFDTLKPGKKDERVVSYATRIITFYSDRDYKDKVLGTRVPSHDIEAFPLPDEEVEKIYGSLVSDNFYVVDLSIRNRTSVAKLVNTGMVIASGRAIVVKNTEGDVKDKDRVEYTVPVSVVPRSATLMYTVLDDETLEQPRSKFFRGLELVGTLASAVTTPYGGIVANQALNIFSGVFVPALNKALPDHWPGYKRNIVNNAMPDLLKIPANSVAGHKHLFFSKNKIDTLISDPTMYDLRYLGSFDTYRTMEIPPAVEGASLIALPIAGAVDLRRLRLKPQSGGPLAKVISLQFDNMDIPFEEVVENAEGQSRVTRQNLELDLIGQIEKLERVRKNKNQVQIDGVAVTYNDLKDYKSLLEKRKQDLTKIDKNLPQYLEGYIAIVQVLQEDATTDLENDLLDGGEHTLEALRRDKERLRSLSTQITSVGEQDALVQVQVKAIAEHKARSVEALEVYRFAAESILQIRSFLEQLGTSNKKSPNDAVKRIKQGLAALIEKRTKLADAGPNQLRILSSVNWSSLAALSQKENSKFELSVEIAGTGAVTSDPPGINCSGDSATNCKNAFPSSDSVTLTVSGGTLKGWGESCAQTDPKEPCKVILDKNKKVTAIFN